MNGTVQTSFYQRCDCENPTPSAEYIPIGIGKNIMDYQLCSQCGLPIQGTQVTHIAEVQP